jgi:molybdate-binding protein
LWVFCSSTVALGALGRRHTHVAGVHLVDPRTGEENLPDVQRHSGHGARAVITLARWQVGILVEKGNPQALRGIADLFRAPRRGVRPLRLTVREKGSGVRRLFDHELGQTGASEATLLAQASLARGHLEVAQAIAMGAADAGLATRDAALAYDLDFIPVSEERYDLALPKAALDDARLQRLFDTLTSAAFRRDLTALGYDARSAGDRLADVLAA